MHDMNLRSTHRLAGSACAVMLAATALVTAAPAHAADKVPFNVTGSVVVTDLCAFPVTVSGPLTGWLITSADGTQVQGHAVEQDTFTAHGKTLTSDPYTFNYHARFDADGNVVSEYFTGQVIVVRLPDGQTFRAAGRTNWANVEQDFNTVPDTGSSKGREAFCEALAP